MAEVLEGERVGVALEAFDEESMALGLHKLLQSDYDPGIRLRCYTAAQIHFSLDEDVARYKYIINPLGLRQ